MPRRTVSRRRVSARRCLLMGVPTIEWSADLAADDALLDGIAAGRAVEEPVVGDLRRGRRARARRHADRVAAVRPAAPGDVVGGRRPGRRAGDPCPRDLTPSPAPAPRHLGGRRGRRGPRRRAPVGHAGPGPGGSRGGRAGDVVRPRPRVGGPGPRRPVGGPDRAGPCRTPAPGGIAGPHRSPAPGAVPGAPRRGRCRQHVPAEPGRRVRGPGPRRGTRLPGTRHAARPAPRRRGPPRTGRPPRGRRPRGPGSSAGRNTRRRSGARRSGPGRSRWSGRSSPLRPVARRPRRPPTPTLTGPGPATTSRTGPG